MGTGHLQQTRPGTQEQQRKQSMQQRTGLAASPEPGRVIQTGLAALPEYREGDLEFTLHEPTALSTVIPHAALPASPMNEGLQPGHHPHQHKQGSLSTAS